SLVCNAIGFRKLFQPKAWAAILLRRPNNPVRAKCICQPNHINNVPAGITVLPLPGIWVIKIAVERMAGYFIIKADVVIASDTSTRLRKLLVNPTDKLRLPQPFPLGRLRRNTGNQTSVRLRQHIIRRLTVNQERLRNDVEIQVRTDTRELSRPIPLRIRTKGFVVVPIYGFRHQCLRLQQARIVTNQRRVRQGKSIEDAGKTYAERERASTVIKTVPTAR